MTDTPSNFADSCSAPLGAFSSSWQPKNNSRSEFLDIRGVTYHVRRWGSPDAPTLVLLHGWLDISASYQFLVDALCGKWNIIAPDWCGFGLSGNRNGAYGYPDYVADLDLLMDHYSNSEAVTIIGHSMGGNVAGIYAGVRPERINKLITLEGFGPVPPLDGDTDRKRMRNWLNGVKSGKRRSSFRSLDEFAERLMKSNPLLSQTQAGFIAQSFSRPLTDHAVEIAADPAHQRFVAPPRATFEFYLSCWEHIRSPVLWIAASNSHIFKAFNDTPQGRALYNSALNSFNQVTEVVMENASHNLHHDCPEQLAKLIEMFVMQS